MKLRTLLIVSLLAFLTLISISSCATPLSTTTTSASSGVAVNTLNLTITSTKTIYQSSEVVSVTLDIKNVSNRNVRINDRLAVHLPWAPMSLWDVTFQVEDGSGQDISTYIRVNKRLPGPKNYALLAPGGIVEHTFSLHGLYQFPKPGKYTIRAIYKNQMDSGDPVDVWQGEVKSDPISITIE